MEVTGDIENAEVAIVALGTIGEEAERSIDYLRDNMNINAVVVRPKVFRPFPTEEIVETLSKVPKALVIDRAVSFGHAGQLAIEIQAEFYNHNVKTKIYPIIRGLGGMDVTYVDIAKEVEKII